MVFRMGDTPFNRRRHGGDALSPTTRPFFVDFPAEGADAARP